MRRPAVGAANQDPRLARVFSTFTADHAELYLDIDRDKAQALGLSISDVFTALQATLGGYLRQRLQPVRPHLAGQHRGRGDRPQRHLRRSGKIYRAQQERRHGAAALDRRRAHRARAAGDQPLQQLPLDHRSTAVAGAGRVLGRCAGGDGADFGAHAAARLSLSNGPAPRIRKSRRAGRPARSSGWRCCSPICSWWRCTKAG